MPYFITDRHPECDNWAVVKEDGELLACHGTEESAIEQMVAVSIAEDMEPGGTYEGEEFRAAPGEVGIGDFVRWNSSGGTARGQIEHVMTEGVLGVPDSEFSINASEEDPAALIRIWRETDEGWEPTEVLVGHRFSTLTKIDELRSLDSEKRDVNLEPPAYMRAAARRGLEYYEQGLGGDGLVDRTIREARAMANGSVTVDKWARIAAWIARHLVDLDAPAADPDNDAYPSPGVVAHLLWGSGPSKRAAERALAYAEGVVGRIEAENEGRARGESVKKLETRTNLTSIEVREESDGMTFEGYAAVFDSDSQPLPFIERIKRGAFTRSLKSRNNIFFYWNHDSGQVLGSTRAGTLQLEEDDRGLRVRAKLPNTTLGRDVAELVRTGVIDSLSFGFSTVKDSWDESGNRRTLEAVRLHEVSLTPVPAYEGTAGSASVRGLDKIAQRADVDAETLATTLLKIEEGEDISIEEKSLVSKVLDTLAPEPEAEEAEETPDAEALALLMLKKKKLELLEALNG